MSFRKTSNFEPSTSLRSRLRTSNLKYGFTLVEFLVVLGVLVTAVAATLLFLTSVFKGANQGNIISEVKQTGQAVLDSLDRQIRNATDVGCKNQTGVAVLCSDSLVSRKYIKLTRSRTNFLHIKCFDQTAIENGWIGSTESSLENPPDANYVAITNKDTVSGVSITNCNLLAIPATQGNTSPPIVSIDFVANQGVRAPSRVDFSANARFSTTISLRKY